MRIKQSSFTYPIKFSGTKTETIPLINCRSLEDAVAKVATLPAKNYALSYTYGEPFEENGHYYVKRTEESDFSGTATNSTFNGENHPLNRDGKRWLGKKNQK